MYAILFRNRISNPGDTWQIMASGLYFDKKQALSDCALFQSGSLKYDYKVYRLKELK